jgi:ABC-type glycerol-3-phosphate transport system substrate-binding protein
MTAQPTRRQFMRIVAIGSTGLLLAACGPSGSTAPTTSTAKPAAPTPATGAAASGAAPTAAPTTAPLGTGGTRIRYMVWGRPDDVGWAHQALVAAHPDEAKKYTIEPLVGGVDDLQVAEKFRLMLSAGGADMPDIIRLNRIEVPEFAEAGVLTDLSEWMKPFTGDMIDSAKALASYKGQYVAVPLTLKGKIWFYRRDLFDKAGVDPDKVTTIDDFVALARTFHAKLPDSYAHNIKATAPSFLYSNVITAFAPVSLYDRQAKKFVIDSNPAFRTAFDVIHKLADPQVSAPVDYGTPDFASYFATNAIGSILIDDWFIRFLPLYAPEQQDLWRAHAWPTTGDSNKGGDSGGGVVVIPKQAKNAQAAFEYLSSIFLNKQGSIEALNSVTYTPYITSARADVLSMPKPTTPNSNTKLPFPTVYFGDNYFQVEFAALDRLTVIDYDQSATKEFGIMSDWGQRVLAGQASVDQAVSGLQADLQSQIGDPYQV